MSEQKKPPISFVTHGFSAVGWGSGGRSVGDVVASGAGGGSAGGATPLSVSVPVDPGLPDPWLDVGDVLGSVAVDVESVLG